MANVTTDQIRNRLAKMERRRSYFEWKSENTRDRLCLHEVWRHAYLARPYLVGAPDERVAKRFCDVVINQTELGRNAKIGVLPPSQGDLLMQKFTHLHEEYLARCGDFPSDIVVEVRKRLHRYFEHGEPVANRIFEKYIEPSSPFLVKYGKREFLEPLLREGSLRVCPASYYSNTDHNEAVRDDEIRKFFYIPTFRERLRGETYVDFNGRRIDFGDADVTLPLIVPDYFLFSLCDHIYYRLPTDFDADAALVIRNPQIFIQRVASAFLARWTDWKPLSGPVRYYDPYIDHSGVHVPQMAKHIGYSYQREIRIAFLAFRRLLTDLQPEFLKIGSMEDYADLVSV